MLMSSNCAREHLTVSWSCLTAWFSSSMWAVLSTFENEIYGQYNIRKCVYGLLLFVMIAELTLGWVVEFSGTSSYIDDRITCKASFCSRIDVMGAIISFFWLAKAVTMLFTVNSKVSRRSRNCWHSVESNSADPSMICRSSATLYSVTFSDVFPIQQWRRLLTITLPTKGPWLIKNYCTITPHYFKFMYIILSMYTVAKFI